VNVYRGADLGVTLSEAAARRGRGGPYREAFAPSSLVPVPVIVRELADFAFSDVDLVGLFGESTRARQSMTGSLTPRLLHAFGQGGVLRASVEEYVIGTPVEALVGALHPGGEAMPPALALAVGRCLVPMWAQAVSAPVPIDLYVRPDDVLIDAAGRVRAVPTYGPERARQAGGGAIGLLDDAVAFFAPEHLQGVTRGERGGMFTLGLLLYAMLAGRHPHRLGPKPPTSFELLSRILNDDAPPLREHCPELHPGVTRFVHQCLERAPEKRFPNWRELDRAFAAVQALVPAAGPVELAAFVEARLPAHPSRVMPAVAHPGDWATLTHTGYESMALPAPRADVGRGQATPRVDDD
jgi:serine/threonine-protein kinase